MANSNTKRLERELEEGLKELLLNMNKEEFTEYFKQLIKKYYEVLFTFENDYSKYYEDSNKKYETTIQVVKDLTGFKYNNLDNFENLERLKQAEEIAYNQMNRLYFMESSYSSIIYYNAIQEVIYITDTLSILIKLYEETSSEKLLSSIGTILNGAVIIFRDVNKLPLDNASLDLDFSSNEDEENYTSDFSNIEQYHLKKVLERFNSILEKLKVLLPEDVATFENKVYAPEEDTLTKTMLEANSDKFSEEEIIEAVAYIKYIKNKDFKGYLYEIIDNS